MSLTDYDEKLARSIQDEINCVGITENAIFPKEKSKVNYRPRTLVDESLEYIDPTPNIYTLFVQFNEKFFWNVLIPVQVKWSPRMTSCAGICSFHPRNKECIISLSTPLLKLRPRKDLIETLLHEMIHAYLFLTNDNRDREGHGPIFKSHMRRINKEAGTNITVYHSFHEEVRLYQQHWWRCNGPCHKRAPFFGTVRRAMNRAPGPNDFWWKEHQLNCNGQFIKIKEPPKPERNKKTKTATNTKTCEKPSILNWLKSNNTNVGNIKNKTTPKISNQPKIMDWRNNKNNSIQNFKTDMKKLGNTTNNVHGWGTGGPSSNDHSGCSPSTSKTITPKSSSKNSDSKLNFVGVLGGRGTGRSILLDKFNNTNTNNTSFAHSSPIRSRLNQTNLSNKPINNSNINQYLENPEIVVTCPSCNKAIDESKINEHLDICLENSEISTSVSDNLNKKRKIESDSAYNKIFKSENKSSANQTQCPLCEKRIELDIFNDHLDNCLQNGQNEEDISNHQSSSNSVNLHDSPHICLICDKALKPNMSLNDHLEDCLASVFHDSTINGSTINVSNINVSNINVSNINDNTINEITIDDSTTDDSTIDDNVIKDKATDEITIDDNALDNNTTNDNLNKSISDEKQVLDEFPCPVCMTLVKESLMNDHLDICLK